jgi:hypothetical protein
VSSNAAPGQRLSVAFLQRQTSKVAPAKEELRKITARRSDAKDFGNKIQPNQ